MKNTAAVPSGAAEKRRLKDLTKLMHQFALIGCRELQSMSPTAWVGSIHASLLCRSRRRLMSSHQQTDIPHYATREFRFAVLTECT